MSYDFFVAWPVAEKISSYRISEYEKLVIRRCVGGYSDSTGVSDRIQKLSYALSQTMNQYRTSSDDAYPDWKKSVKFLNYVGLSKNGTLTFEQILSIPMVNGQGEAMLRALIKENSELIVAAAAL